MFETEARTGSDLLLLAVDRLLEEDPVFLAGPAALERLRTLLTARERLQAAVLAAVRDVDLRDLSSLEGAGSTRGWLRAQVTGDDGQLTLARGLALRSVVRQALVDGGLAVRGAAQLCSALDKVPDQVDDAVLQAVLLDGVGALLTADEGGTPEGEPPVELLARRVEAEQVLQECCARTLAPPAERLEPAFVLLASRLTPNLLGTALRSLLDALVADGSDGDDHDPYYLHLRPLHDGDWDLRGLLDPETGQSLAAEIERRRAARAASAADCAAVSAAPSDALALFGGDEDDVTVADPVDATLPDDAPVPADAAPAGATPADPADPDPAADPADAYIAALSGPCPERPGSLVLAGRRRHDAFAPLLRDASGARAGEGAPAPVAFTVVAGPEAVLGRPGALPGLLHHPGRPPVPLSAETLQRLGCHSELAAVLLDALGNPVGASSTRRSANLRERRALRARWGPTCAVRGCPETGAVPHHVEPWWLSRRTRLRDLVPLCGHCHRDLHEGHRTLRLRDGRWIDERGWAAGARAAA